MTTLDINYVRSQFPAFDHPETGQWAFFENAGGSYAAAPVVKKLNHFMEVTKMQPYGMSGPSKEAGEAMDESHRRLAAAINADVDEVMFGPSTSMNTYVVAQAMRSRLKPGDEVIVTNQDHEANIGAWRRLADGDTGVVLREWQVDKDTGLLDVNDFKNLLNERTRLVCVTHCSNIVGDVNDIAEIANLSHDAGALIAADGVSYAPHLVPKVKQLGVDFYFFSLYKIFGPHQGLMYVRKQVLDTIANQGHFFNRDEQGKRLTPAGPQHGEIACASGMVDYLEQASHHHFRNQNETTHKCVSDFMALGHEHETEQTKRILALLRDKGVRVIGRENTDDGQRAPTIAFTTPKLKPAELAEKLSHQKVGVGEGHFYVYRLMQALNIPPEDGVVRISLVHYTSAEEVDRLLNGLDETL